MADLSTSDETPDNFTTNEIVAVRKSSESKIWLRGRIEQLHMYGKLFIANVFLIDYGEEWKEICVQTCMKKIPYHINQESPSPLAIKIVLKGLQPVSMDIDFIEGKSLMEVTPQNEWDYAAWNEVRRAISKFDGIAELRNWILDGKGRYQGQLHLVDVKTSKEFHLNQMLIVKKFAVENSYVFEHDMEDLIQHEETEVGSHSSTELQSDMTSSLKNHPLLDKLKKKNSNLNLLRGIEGGASDFSVKPESENRCDEDMWSSVRKNCRVDDNDSNVQIASHLFPGGVFVGRRHEKILAHLQNEHVTERKAKFKDFISARKDEDDYF